MEGSCDSALPIITRRFMPPDSVMIFESFLSQSERSRSTFSSTAGFGGLPNSPREKAMVFHTVSNMSVVSSWGTRPILARAARNSRTLSWPSASTWPVEAVTMPQMMLMSVVLPAPLGPSRAKISPRRISRSTFLRAWKPEAYCLETPATFKTEGAGTDMGA
jgi:hypothetical protein